MKRRTTRLRRHGVWGVAALTAVACISEHAPVEPPGATANCEVPLDEIRRGAAIVLIRGFSFMPDTVHIRPGGTVVWVNCESTTEEPHTATARENEWSSPLLQPGRAWARTFDAAGDHDYFCLPHPVMRGVVRVD